MYHYVYRISCRSTNQHYYGVRSSKIEPELDVVVYRSSSRVVHQYIKTYGIDNFKFKVLKLFSTRVDAMAYECFLHEKFNVDSNPKFMNLSRNRSTRAFYSAPGEKNNSWAKKMMYLDRDVVFVTPEEVDLFTIKGYTLGRPEWLICHRFGSQNNFYGKKHSHYTKQKISEFKSKPIKVKFECGKEVTMRNRLELGPLLGMSASLGASLVTRKRTHLFKKYEIESIEVINEYILHQEG